MERVYRAAQKQRASDTVHMTRNESANSQEHSLITTLANSIRRLPFSAAGYAYIRDCPINPALSAGLIPWWNQFTVGGCYTYRARAVIKLLLQAGRTPIDMGGHRTPTLALFPRRCIYEPFIHGSRPLLITRDINESVKDITPSFPTSVLSRILGRSRGWKRVVVGATLNPAIPSFPFSSPFAGRSFLKRPLFIPGTVFSINVRAHPACVSLMNIRTA